jgi:hypothetical protein
MYLFPVQFDHNAVGIAYDGTKPFGGLPKPQFPFGFTMFWSQYTKAHTQSFGTHWFMARDEAVFSQPSGYFGCANRFTTPNWNFSVSAFGLDFISTDNIVLGKWYRQAYRRTEDPALVGAGNLARIDYFYDLPDVSKVITATGSGAGSLWALTTAHNLRLFDVPWAVAEGLDGRIDRVKIYETYMPARDIVAEARYAWPVLGKYLPRLYCCIPDLRLAYMRDVSERGHHFKVLINDASHLADIDPPYQIPKHRRQQHDAAWMRAVAAAAGVPNEIFIDEDPEWIQTVQPA